ncbi:hypothetical protein [Domibacillus iocasae]|uniref:hypothetical protein n=1 Tax=Domibacillus iocasae TaxID=1714016 RepID=UPI00147202A2|nr:hypothetical protein [Domibacillus iocasae]
MANRRAIVEQQWTQEEMNTYCEKFEEKRPAYLRKAEQTMDGRFSSRRKRVVHSNGNL